MRLSEGFEMMNECVARGPYQVSMLQEKQLTKRVGKCELLEEQSP